MSQMVTYIEYQEENKQVFQLPSLPNPCLHVIVLKYAENQLKINLFTGRCSFILFLNQFNNILKNPWCYSMLHDRMDTFQQKGYFLFQLFKINNFHLGAILLDQQALTIVWKDPRLPTTEHHMTSTLSCTMVFGRKLSTSYFHSVQIMCRRIQLW